jgi:glucokinase
VAGGIARKSTRAARSRAYSLASVRLRHVLTIGLDVGGTKVLGAVVDPARPTDVVRELRVPTPAGGAGLVDVLADVVDHLRVDGPIAAVGVGVPGLVDADGVLRAGAHLASVADLPLARALAERCGAPVEVDNDANAAAVAEHRGGAGAGVDDLIVITLGTGIGGGIIVEGRLRTGAHGFAGEPGHMVVDPNGPPCPCGQRGCWEQFASGSGLARLARSAALGGQLLAAVELAGGDPELVRGEHVTATAKQGDGQSMAVLDELADWIAVGLANLVNVFDPEVVVIGGGLVDAAELLLPRAQQRVHQRILAGGRRPLVPVVPAQLGERAGAIGSALLAADLVA